MNINILLTAVLAVLGALGGFLYYKFVGCVTGTCPITSNPWSSSVYGAVLGILVSRFWS